MGYEASQGDKEIVKVMDKALSKYIQNGTYFKATLRNMPEYKALARKNRGILKRISSGQRKMRAKKAKQENCLALLNQVDRNVKPGLKSRDYDKLYEEAKLALRKCNYKAAELPYNLKSKRMKEIKEKHQAILKKISAYQADTRAKERRLREELEAKAKERARKAKKKRDKEKKAKKKKQIRDLCDKFFTELNPMLARINEINDEKEQLNAYKKFKDEVEKRRLLCRDKKKKKMYDGLIQTINDMIKDALEAERTAQEAERAARQAKLDAEARNRRERDEEIIRNKRQQRAAQEAERAAQEAERAARQAKLDPAAKNRKEKKKQKEKQKKKCNSKVEKAKKILEELKKVKRLNSAAKRDLEERLQKAEKACDGKGKKFLKIQRKIKERLEPEIGAEEARKQREAEEAEEARKQREAEEAARREAEEAEEAARREAEEAEEAARKQREEECEKKLTVVNNLKKFYLTLDYLNQTDINEIVNALELAKRACGGANNDLVNKYEELIISVTNLLIDAQIQQIGINVKKKNVSTAIKKLKVFLDVFEEYIAARYNYDIDDQINDLSTENAKNMKCRDLYNKYAAEMQNYEKKSVAELQRLLSEIKRERESVDETCKGAMIETRTGKYIPVKTGLTNFKKPLEEQIKVAKLAENQRKARKAFEEAEKKEREAREKEREASRIMAENKAREGDVCNLDDYCAIIGLDENTEYYIGCKSDILKNTEVGNSYFVRPATEKDISALISKTFYSTQFATPSSDWAKLMPWRVGYEEFEKWKTEVKGQPEVDGQPEVKGMKIYFLMKTDANTSPITINKTLGAVTLNFVGICTLSVENHIFIDDKERLGNEGTDNNEVDVDVTVLHDIAVKRTGIRNLGRYLLQQALMKDKGPETVLTSPYTDDAGGLGTAKRVTIFEDWGFKRLKSREECEAETNDYESEDGNADDERKEEDDTSRKFDYLSTDDMDNALDNYNEGSARYRSLLREWGKAVREAENYQTGSLSSSGKELRKVYEKWKQSKLAGADNNNNVTKNIQRLKQGAKVVGKTAKKVREEESEKQLEETVESINEDEVNAIKLQLNKLQAIYNKKPARNQIINLLKALLRTHPEIVNVLENKGYGNYLKDGKLITTRAMRKKEDIIKTWWEMLLISINQLNTVWSYLGGAYTLPKEPPNKLFEEDLSLDLEHIWDYAEDTSVPEPMTFGLAARKAKQFSVFE
nr:hypothetical protein [Allomuricauda sp.]